MVKTAPPGDSLEGARPATRERLLASAVDLLMRQGLAGTGIKQILTAADATFSSLYHHFPGGKDQLAAEAIVAAGDAYKGHVAAVWDAASDPVAAVTGAFEVAAAVLEASDYADACPIETVALEVASTNDRLRAATAEVFDSWVTALEDRLVDDCVSTADARRLALTVIMLLEGAFVLCRAARSTEALRVAGGSAAELMAAALANPPRIPGPEAPPVR